MASSDLAVSITLRVPPALKREVEALAKDEMTSESSIIRRALKIGLPVVRFRSQTGEPRSAAS